MSSQMKEDYKILHKSSEECQKILNQWKHQYNIEIISMAATANNMITILLIRRNKEC